MTLWCVVRGRGSMCCHRWRGCGDYSPDSTQDCRILMLSVLSLFRSIMWRRMVASISVLYDCLCRWSTIISPWRKDGRVVRRRKRQRIRKFMSGVLDSRLRPFTQNGLTGESWRLLFTICLIDWTRLDFVESPSIHNSHSFMPSIHQQ